MDKRAYIAKQIRRALQIFIQTITDESSMMEVADIYPAFEVGKEYDTGAVFSYGVNDDGETQLYKVIGVKHVSSSEHMPDTTISLYKKVGINSDGINIWTQPYGASDAYNVGDRVEYDGQIWVSDCNDNVWVPGVYGWSLDE